MNESNLGTDKLKDQRRFSRQQYDMLKSCSDKKDMTEWNQWRNQNPAQEFLRDTFKTKTLSEWLEWFEDVDAAFAPVNDLREACDDPQIRHREMIIEDARGWEHLGIPIKFDQEPGQTVFEFATLGQHTDEILKAIGYDDGMLAAVHSSSVSSHS